MLADKVGRVHDSSDAEVQHELGGDVATKVDTCRQFERNIAAGRFNVTPDTSHYATLLALVKEMGPAD